MSRLPVVVRNAEPADAAALIDLWGCCAAAADDEPPVAGATTATTAAVGAAWREPRVAEAAEALGAYTADSSKRLLVAMLDEEIVGVLAANLRSMTPIHRTETLVVSDLHVSPPYRRKAVASTLMSAAVSWAEENDCEVVLTSTPAPSRDAHRFLTRLGFGQVAVIRGAQTSALRARFVSRATSSKDTGRLIAVRRTLRRRQRASYQVVPRGS